MSTIESSEWAVVQTRGTDLVLGSGIAYDGAGGALVTGYFSGHASFGSTFLTSRGTEDAFVMHVTASGAIDWAVQAGDRGLFADQDDHDSSSTTSHDPGYCIAHDGAGGAFVTGFFMDGASFGSTLLKSRGLADAFVMHVTASGAIDWAVQAGGANLASGRGIAHDGAGGALVTGYFSGQASFGSTSLTSRGSTDAFVMHVTASGAIDWAVQAGGESATSSRGIAHDGAGGALVTGYFKQMVDSRRLPVASFGSTSLTAQGSADAFVMHVTASGAIDWAVQAGGADTNTGGYGIAHDGAGGALVTGDFNGKVSFGSTSLTGQGNCDAFVMHVTASGAIDWAVQAGGASVDRGWGIAHDGAGGALVTGRFSGRASFGSTILTSHDSADGFVMHVTASGAIDWAVGSSAYPRAIAHDGVGGTLVTGYFSGNASFGSTALTSLGNAPTCFVASIMPPPDRPPLPPRPPPAPFHPSPPGSPPESYLSPDPRGMMALSPPSQPVLHFWYCCWCASIAAAIAV
jgi:hypothetical protein